MERDDAVVADVANGKPFHEKPRHPHERFRRAHRFEVLVVVIGIADQLETKSSRTRGPNVRTQQCRNSILPSRTYCELFSQP